MPFKVLQCVASIWETNRNARVMPMLLITPSVKRNRLLLNSEDNSGDGSSPSCCHGYMQNVWQSQQQRSPNFGGEITIDWCDDYTKNIRQIS